MKQKGAGAESRVEVLQGSHPDQPFLTGGWGGSNRKTQPTFTLKAAGALFLARFPTTGRENTRRDLAVPERSSRKPGRGPDGTLAL